MKKIMLKGMAALCVCAAFASCSKDVAYDANFANKQREASYEEAFIKQFGPISPTQNWDFTKVSKATTRAAEGEVATVIAQFDMDNPGFDWIWKDSKTDQGELNQSTFKNLWKKKDYIRGEVATASYIPWNPSKYGKVYFRLFATSNDKSTYSEHYYRFGINVPTTTASQNYWLVSSNTKYDNWITEGYKIMDHTRCLDFTKLPEGISWFDIAQASSGNHQNDAIYASEHQIQYFKEVTVNIDGVDYTFWAFNCTGKPASNDNLILWVKAEEKQIPQVTEKRYMAEDLGGAGDIDFNDIVFDIVEDNNGQKGYVRALGGTLDIAILVNGVERWRKDPKYPIKEMVNTGYKGSAIDYHATLAEFDATGWDANANNVSIAVYGDGSQAQAVTYINFPVEGSIPKMIAVDVRKYWEKEQVKISSMDWFTQLDEE